MKPIFFSILFSLVSFTNIFSQEFTKYCDLKNNLETTINIDTLVIADAVVVQFIVTVKNLNRRKDFDGFDELLRTQLDKIGMDSKSQLMFSKQYTNVRYSGISNSLVESRMYELRSYDMDKLGKVFLFLDSQGINQISLVEKIYNNKLMLQTDLKVIAIKRAKNQTDLMLESIGQKTGKLISTKISVKEHDESNSLSGNKTKFVSSSSAIYFISKIRYSVDLNAKFEIL